MEDNPCYRLYGCYGLCTYKRKCSFWEEMGIRIQNEILPWIMFGDLNEVIDNSEKLGGRGLRNKRLFLSDFMQIVGAVDLAFTGCKFIWVNNHDKQTFIQERLDRAIASTDLLKNVSRTWRQTYFQYKFKKRLLVHVKVADKFYFRVS